MLKCVIKNTITKLVSYTFWVAKLATIAEDVRRNQDAGVEPKFYAWRF